MRGAEAAAAVITASDNNRADDGVGDIAIVVGLATALYP
jgi:hypothetical protein